MPYLISMLIVCGCMTDYRCLIPTAIISIIYGNYVNFIDKSLSGKSDEREVKICENQLFTLHPSFFIFPSLRFLTLIPYL